MIFILVAICVLPGIFYLITLQNTLKEVSPENRKMNPGQVWLLLIPLFNIVWQFVIVNRIADSLKNEFIKRNILIDEDRPGYSIGLAYCILGCCSCIPVLSILTSIAGLVCWIIYWVKISDYKRKLQRTIN